MKASYLKLVPILFFQAAVIFAQPPSSSASDQAEAVKGSNAFAVDLYAELRGEPGNLFFSPESISTAFAMADAGAKGETAAEIGKVFHFTLPPEKLHPAEGALLAQMNGQHQGFELRVADALWAQQDASFLPGYLTLVQTDYGAGFRPVDFKSSPDASRTAINQWVEQQTNNKIQNLLGPGTVTPATRLVLTNAIYFKGTWLNTFRADLTDDEDFHLTAKQTIQTKMMNRTGGYNYYDGGSFQELELPYKGAELSMVVLLPKEIGGLPALEKSFTAANASKWIEKLAPAEKVVLTLPRFNLTQQFELSSTLTKMGMPQAFTGAADFSGMTGKPDFAISAAIHKAYIDVNEEGTEAAAATAITMVTMAMQSPRQEPPPVVFDADHPFLFLIRSTDTGAILFLGRVEDPTKQ
ncbi:MAG: serpin family protein [Terracidiphilus sp.]